MLVFNKDSQIDELSISEVGSAVKYILDSRTK